MTVYLFVAQDEIQKGRDDLWQANPRSLAVVLLSISYPNQVIHSPCLLPPAIRLTVPYPTTSHCYQCLSLCSATTGQRKLSQVTTVGSTCLKALEAVKKEWSNLQPKLWPLPGEAAVIQVQLGEPPSQPSAVHRGYIISHN